MNDLLTKAPFVCKMQPDEEDHQTKEVEERNGGCDKVVGSRSQKPQVGKASLCFWRRVGGQGMTQFIDVYVCVFAALSVSIKA